MAFRKAIIANPCDDLPRLVYADWLEDRGDPLGEFIRVQIQLASTNLAAEQQTVLEQRESELLLEHADRIHLNLPAECKQTFRRGFIDCIDCAGESVLQIPKTELESAPPASIRCRSIWPAIAGAFRSSEILELIRALEISHSELGDEGVTTIIDSLPHNRLVRLALIECHLNDQVAERISACNKLHHLKSLDLSRNWFSDEAAASLTKSAQLGDVCELRLAGEDDFDRFPSPHRLRAGAAGSIARSRYLNRLELLDLANNHIGDAGVLALAMSGNCSSLKTLILSGNDICASGDMAIDRLCESPFLEKIDLLDVTMNPLGRKARRLLRRRFGDRVLM